jgi:hypothetical protein
MAQIPEGIATKAAAIQGGLNGDVNQVRSNPDLSPDGRVRQLAIAYLRARSEMDEPQASWAGTTAIKVESRPVVEKALHVAARAGPVGGLGSNSGGVRPGQNSGTQR